MKGLQFCLKQPTDWNVIMARLKLSSRLARVEDVSQLYEIIQTAYRTECGWTNESALVSGERITHAELQRTIELGHDMLLVAETADGTVVGCIAAEASHIHTALELPPKAALLGLFAVDPSCQSQGVGSFLMREVMERVRVEWGCELAVVWVIQLRTVLIQWYERLGFKDTGKRRDFVLPDKALRPEETWFRVFEKPLLPPPTDAA